MKKTNIWRIIKQYHWESAFFKHCFRWFLVVLIPTFLLGSLITFYGLKITRQNIEKEKKYYQNNIIEQNKSLFNNIENFHYSLSSDSNVYRYCLNFTTDSNDLHGTISNITSLINTFVSSNPCIESVYFYAHNNNYLHSNITSGYMDSFFDTKWSHLINNKSTTIISRHFNQKKYITVFIPIFIDGYNIASAIYNIDAEKYMKMSATNNFNICIKLFDRNNNVLFSSSNDNHLNSSEFVTPISHNISLGLRLIQSNNAFVQNLPFWIFWIAFIILFILDIVLSYHLSLNYFILVVDNIMQFQSLYCDQAENDALLSELDFIIHNPIKPNKTKDVEHFLINQYRKLNSSRMSSMQEQINPHFVFNTLNLISLIDMDIENENKGVISKITKNLADILRYSIETTSNIISFTEEILYLDKYMEIQNVKYEGKFNYIKKIDPDSSNCTIIKFILQPIVENAIVHGILTSPTKAGTITVSTKVVDNTFIITIANTGTKIENDKIHQLNDILKTYTDSDGKHIGMINVNNRIKLLYGKKYGCKITSDDSLTKVTLTMPYTHI